MTITLTVGGVHKGGVGKTTAAVTIGHGLALAGGDVYGRFTASLQRGAVRLRAVYGSRKREPFRGLFKRF